MSSTTIETLKQAIKAKRNVAFTYDGHDRECSPHAIGWKDDKVNVLVYQFGGSTSKGKVTSQGPANWRCMLVANIKSLEEIEGEWHTWGNHSQPSTCIDKLIAEVDY